MEEHENLTWFIGDALCRKCAKRHGIWREESRMTSDGLVAIEDLENDLVWFVYASGRAKITGAYTSQTRPSRYRGQI
jgi:hypothetical protein